MKEISKSDRSGGPTTPFGCLNVVVALRAEATPLIEHFGLRSVARGSSMPSYEDAGARVRLIISGVGKVASAAAVVDLWHRGGAQRSGAWLNVGTGGHARRVIGDTVVAHKITDAAADCSWYPQLVCQPPCDTAALLTLDRPISDYPVDEVVEMEAAGFYATAIRYAVRELIHSIKLISDNRSQPVEYVSSRQIDGLFRSQMETIEAFAATLLELSHAEHRRLGAPTGLDLCNQRWRFTATQQRQLRRLLWRWSTMGTNPDELGELLRGQRHARGVLMALREALDAAPVTLASLSEPR